ncbi:outer membrane homotrimeric porin [Desulfovibrio sp. ZJ369]|uniref:outer membrane homotrimeric porin n=1 Tax=Desulfovibrio sp. ZJ369 TaxID=2709793 RepID=UPI0013EB3F61|nr:outer membrane homotrimeric porin [Desulfovibrio sp. ZJ369]
MKKLTCLLLAAGLLFGAVTEATAVDFKAKGEWIIMFDYGQNGALSGGNGNTGFNNLRNLKHNSYGQDEFEATQRLRLQLDAIASENLSGTVFFEIGQQRWGKADEGGALGADGTMVKLKNAYLDWIVPSTDLKIRMGISNMSLPSYTMHVSQIFAADSAGVTATWAANENISVTAFWARLLNDNLDADNAALLYNGKKKADYLDNIDLFALSVPMTFDGIKITPFFAYSMLGPNAIRMYQREENGRYFNVVHTIYPNDHRNFPKDDSKDILTGMFPIGGARHENGTRAGEWLRGYGNAWWAGFASDFTLWDPWHIAVDFNYGSVTWDNRRLNRSGWVASGLVEYKLDWGVPGIYGWYASGDDGDASNGSERMPYLANSDHDNDFASYAFAKDMSRASGQIGQGVTGTWGLGLRLKDVSFLEDLKHTLRLVYIGGTNSPKMGRKVRNFYGMRADGSPSAPQNRSHFWVGMDGEYLTTLDSAMEASLSTTYKIYDNLTVSFDAAYVPLWLDSSVWKNVQRNGTNGCDVRDMWNLNVAFIYSF